MAELKTKQTDASVETFLNGIADARQREDALQLLGIMRKATGEAPRMWGASIVGFGSYHYVYASGHEGDACLAGFSPRKNALTIYGLLGNDESKALVEKLGKVKLGKGCLYVKRLEDVDLAVLREMIQVAWKHQTSKASCQPEPAPAKKSRKKT